jgi:hypothetical protein
MHNIAIRTSFFTVFPSLFFWDLFQNQSKIAGAKGRTKDRAKAKVNVKAKGRKDGKVRTPLFEFNKHYLGIPIG